jgi:hypothetical protein
MREVLAACGTADTGTVWVSDLVAHRVRRGEPIATVRASLSRTLRRLWRLGLVDLGGKWRAFPTRSQHEQATQAEANDPERYQRACAFRAAFGMEELSPEAYRAQCAWRAQHPDVYARRVILTDAGREWLALNSDVQLGRLVRRD